MTKEERLKSMSKRERVSTFFPLLLKGELTKEQYDKLLTYGIRKDIQSLPPEESIQIEERVDTTFKERVGGTGQTPTDEEITKQKDVPAYVPSSTRGENKRPSQKRRLLSLLSDGEPHNTVEIQEKVYGGDHLGVARIAPRILELRKEGHNIETKKESKTIFSYQIKEKEVLKQITNNISSG